MAYGVDQVWLTLIGGSVALLLFVLLAILYSEKPGNLHAE